MGGGVGNLRMGVPGYGVADAPKPVGTGSLEGFQHRLNLLAQIEIGMAHYGGGGPAGSINTAGAGRGQALHKLHLADGPHLLGAIRPVHGSSLDKHRGADIMAAAYVVQQLVKQISLVGNAGRTPVPEMMMRVANGQFRLQNFFLGQGQPVISTKGHKGRLRRQSLVGQSYHAYIWTCGPTAPRRKFGLLYLSPKDSHPASYTGREEVGL